MSDELLIAIVGALFNGAVTWGIVSTKLAWMRSDIDKQDGRIAALERERREARA